LVLSTFSVKLCWLLLLMPNEDELELAELDDSVCRSDHGTGMSFPLEELELDPAEP